LFHLGEVEVVSPNRSIKDKRQRRRGLETDSESRAAPDNPNDLVLQP